MSIFLRPDQERKLREKEAENDPKLAAQLADEKEKAKNFDEFSE